MSETIAHRHVRVADGTENSFALQSERYFKELFHFNTTLYRELKNGSRREP